MSFDEAVEQLRIEYEKAKKNKHIKNPIAYALYHTWRMADSKKEREQNEHNKGNKNLSRNKQF